MGSVPLGVGGFDVRTKVMHQANQERDGLVGFQGFFRGASLTPAIAWAAVRQHAVRCRCTCSSSCRFLREKEIGCDAYGVGEAKCWCVSRILGQPLSRKTQHFGMRRPRKNISS